MIAQLLLDARQRSPHTEFLVGATHPPLLPHRLTFDQAAAAMLKLAGLLRARRITRVACHALDSPKLVLLMCAAAATGAEVCVLNRDYPRDEVETLLNRFDFKMLITDSLATATPPLEDVEVIDLHTFFDEAMVRSEDTTPLADNPRLLVLTTGTTGTPKGAIYTWSNLTAQARHKPELAGTRWLLAYHLNHFAGVQMLVHVLTNRTTLVIPESPQVDAAVAAMSEHRVEYVSGTPTFWRFVLAQLGPARAKQLPVRQITLGGEAVPADLLRMLAEHFPHAKVSQIFATTEIGSVFSVRDMASGLPLALFEKEDEHSIAVKIVDNELHVRSRHGMLGYYGEPETDGPQWRATGDLLEVRDGRVFFVGRKSETINVGGVKVHPLPIEELVQKVHGVAAVHCYGKKNPVVGALVALDVVPAENIDRQDLETRIRAACETLARHAQPRIIRFVEQLDMANRKVLRRADK